MIEFGLQLALQQGSAFLGLLSPFAVGVADPQANIDEISISFQRACGKIEEFEAQAEIAVLIKSLLHGLGKDESILVAVSAKELGCEGI